jgi:AraC family transcriptional regulator
MRTTASWLRPRALTTMVAFLAVAAAGSAIRAADQGDAAAAIRAASAELRGALQRGDIERLVDAYTDDAQLIMAGKTVVGREGVRSHVAMALAAGLRDVSLDEQEIFPGNDIAVETGRATFRSSTGVELGTSRYMTLWKKIGGRWRICRDFSVPAPVAKTPAQPTTAAFAVKQVEAHTVVVLPMTGAFSQHGDAIGRLAATLGSSIIGPPFGRYFNSPENVPESELRWEVGFPVKPDTTVTAPFERRDVPAETVAYAIVAGPHEGSRPWQQLVEWVVAEGYEVTGPAVEIWLDGPKTEMQISVRKDGTK